MVKSNWSTQWIHWVTGDQYQTGWFSFSSPILRISCLQRDFYCCWWSLRQICRFPFQDRAPGATRLIVAMDSSQPSLRTLILTAAKHLSLEWQNDRIRLRLPSDPPVDRCHSGPFARALRRYIPEIQVEEWDAACSDTGRQPMVYSMEKGLMSKYVHWARCLGLAEENLALPPWLTPLTAPDALSRGPAQPGVEPSFFSEPQARNLAEYQKRAIRFGVSISGKVLLADDLGLGKSIQALGVAWQYRETFPLLILCPPVQRNVWQQEIAKWTPIPVTEVQEVLTKTTVLETTARVIIVSYAFLEKFEELQSSAEIDFKVVIADECHSIKHFDAHKSKVILRIASLAQRLILISSDKLVKKSAAELHPLFQSLDPYLGTQETFLRRYFGGKLGKLGRRIDPRREQELEAYLFKVIGIRRKTAEVSSELLPLRRQRIFLPKSGCSLSMGELKQMETEMFHRQRFVSDSSVSKQARLSEMKRVSHLVMQTKRRSCVEYVTETTNNGGKMLVFAYHREMLGSLEAALKETLGASGYVRIDQKTPTHSGRTWWPVSKKTMSVTRHCSPSRPCPKGKACHMLRQFFSPSSLGHPVSSCNVKLVPTGSMRSRVEKDLVLVILFSSNTFCWKIANGTLIAMSAWKRSCGMSRSAPVTLPKSMMRPVSPGPSSHCLQRHPALRNRRSMTASPWRRPLRKGFNILMRDDRMKCIKLLSIFISA